MVKMNKIFVKYFSKISWACYVTPVLCLLFALLIVCYSEAGVIEIIKLTGKTEVISAIAGFFSAIAAFLSYRAAERSAIAAERSLINLTLPYKLKTQEALRIIWDFLNRKSCKRALDPDRPEEFLISLSEIEKIEAQREPILVDSIVYGSIFHEKIIRFYLNLKSELEAQMRLCDHNVYGSTLSPENQSQHLQFREQQRDEVLALLEESRTLLYVLRDN